MKLRKLLSACVAQEFGSYYVERIPLPRALVDLCSQHFIDGVPTDILYSQFIRRYTKHFMDGKYISEDEDVPSEFQLLIDGYKALKAMK